MGGRAGMEELTGQGGYLVLLAGVYLRLSMLIANDFIVCLRRYPVSVSLSHWSASLNLTAGVFTQPYSRCEHTAVLQQSQSC